MTLRFKLRMVFVIVLAFGGLGGAGLLRATEFDDGFEDEVNFNAPPPDHSPLNIAKVDRAFGVSLLRGPSLWNEKDADVAARLRWPEESRTSTESSYRTYSGGGLKILGVGTYSCALYASHAKPTEISIFFMNRGDYNWDANKPQPKAGQPVDPYALANALNTFQEKKEKTYEKTLKQEMKTLTDKLTGLFGPPGHQSLGGGMSERVLRWDWQGHSFMLSMSDIQYVVLRIAPVSFADNLGRDTTMTRPDLIATLLKRVKRSSSGDVVVTDIPMVDQGPKGYCVLATWERYMRYLGIPVDMYVLAAASGTGNGGGSSGSAVAGAAYNSAAFYHRRIDGFQGSLDIKDNIAPNIDQGIPLMWGCGVYGSLEGLMGQRMSERKNVTDWKAWADSLVKEDKKEIPAITKEHIANAFGLHDRMIIGYNEKTDEIAISDSWGNGAALRWMTLPEANASNSGDVYLIMP